MKLLMIIMTISMESKCWHHKNLI